MKTINFGIEHLTKVNGRLAINFLEAVRKKEWEFVNVKEVKIIEIDNLNQKTIIRFTAPIGDWENDEKGKFIQTFPYLFICQHAKDMSCSSQHISEILNWNIDDYLNFDYD